MFSNPFTRLTRKEIGALVLVVLICGAIRLWLPGRLNVVVSGSLAHRIFILSGPPAKIEIGDYLVFKYDDLSFMDQKRLSTTSLLTKEVGCTPGATLAVDVDRRFSCNGKPLGQALKTDSQENTLPQFVFNGVIPQDSYYMTGSDARSFDSKYFGFIKKNEILYKAYPIW